MEISFGLTSSQPLDQITGIAGLVDRYGGSLWIREDAEGRHDIFSLAAFLASRCRNARLGIGVSNPLYHNITTIARAVALTTEIGGSGLRLGLGVGGINRFRSRIPRADQTEALCGASRILREIWQGGAVSYRSSGYRLSGYISIVRPRRRIPIYLGSSRPRILRLAGKVADGVVLSGPRPYLAKAVELVGSGLREAGKSRRSFTVVAWNPGFVIEDPKSFESLRHFATYVIAGMPKAAINRHGIDADKMEDIRRRVADGDIGGASRLVGEELLKTFTFYGTPREICQGMRSLEGVGIDEAVLGPPYGVDWRSAVLEMIRECRA
ncbi:MAG: LLM class flavin-dependent oxidoreductase [Candidatus Bathyarchaeia archaeon]